MKLSTFCGGVLLATVSQATAAVEVTFRDGNPWDVFLITSTDCPISEAELRIDLTTSVAGVLIDTEYGGAGTQDPLPAELASGDAILRPVSDGDQLLTVQITRLDVDTPIRLQMDVDDTAGTQYAPRVQVALHEMTGATVTLSYAGSTTSAPFDPNGLARVPLAENAPSCALIG